MRNLRQWVSIMGAAVLAAWSVQAALAQDACDPKAVASAIFPAASSHQPLDPAVPVTDWLASGLGSSSAVVVERKFSADEIYRVLVQIGDDPAPSPGDLRLLQRASVMATPISPDHPLVKNQVVSADSTVVTMYLPSGMVGTWTQGTIYVIGCGKAGGTDFVAATRIVINSAVSSFWMVWAVCLLSYALFALAVRHNDKPRLAWYRYLDPVVLTAGPNGKGSLSKLQILFFSYIVFGLVLFIALKTGILTNLSPNILILLGIAGVTTAVSTQTDQSKNRLKFQNWAWLVSKHWLPPGGLAEKNTATWNDLVTSNREFDVYRFQSLMFSLIVGAILLATGMSTTDLSGFKVPEAFLEILGLSQAIYLGGKLVAPPTCKELDESLDALVGLEKAFGDRVNQARDAAGNPLPPPKNLDEAKARAPAEYAAFAAAVQKVKIMFEASLNISLEPGADLAPSYG